MINKIIQELNQVHQQMNLLSSKKRMLLDRINRVFPIKIGDYFTYMGEYHGKLIDMGATDPCDTDKISIWIEYWSDKHEFKVIHDVNVNELRKCAPIK